MSGCRGPAELPYSGVFTTTFAARSSVPPSV
jgi:hypothetical protein